ncbi:MAG: hypothetical protein AB7K24_14690 [Gemmataceae bacterium]
MALLITCPLCQEQLDLADASAGQKVTCPQCQHQFEFEAQEKSRKAAIAKRVDFPRLSELKLDDLPKSARNHNRISDP